MKRSCFHHTPLVSLLHLPSGLRGGDCQEETHTSEQTCWKGKERAELLAFTILFWSLSSAGKQARGSGRQEELSTGDSYKRARGGRSGDTLTKDDPHREQGANSLQAGTEMELLAPYHTALSLVSDSAFTLHACRMLDALESPSFFPPACREVLACLSTFLLVFANTKADSSPQLIKLPILGNGLGDHDIDQPWSRFTICCMFCFIFI